MAAFLTPPIAFAHRGARSHAPENTIEAFALALRLGAPGLESDVWITADGVAVLDHDGVVKTGMRRRMIRDLDRSALPSSVPSLEDLYAICGTSFELSLDLKDPMALGPVVDVARAAAATERLWLCDHHWERLAANRSSAHDVRLVDSTRLKRLQDGPERHAARLRDVGIDAINLHCSDWTLGLTTLFHRFGLHVFGWDAQHDRILQELVRIEIDGLFCDDVELMMSTVTAER
jgi:glycerophosphoryl diester phosphodiesterase